MIRKSKRDTYRYNMSLQEDGGDNMVIDNTEEAEVLSTFICTSCPM